MQNEKVFYCSHDKKNWFLLYLFFAKAFNGILTLIFTIGDLLEETTSKHKINILYKKDKKNKKKIFYKKNKFCHNKKYTL